MGCSAGSSKKKNYCGDYVIELREFVESFAEFKEEEKEQECEAAMEACEYYNCNVDDDEACENKCLASKGFDYCIEDENEEEFDLGEFLECREAEFGNNNNNNNNNNNALYYMGPYCSNSGSSIHLGVFTDSSCSIQAKSNVYETYNYGATLPYSKDSIVDNKCHSCMEVDDNDDDNGNDQYYDAELIQLCEENYEQSANVKQMWPTWMRTQRTNFLVPTSTQLSLQWRMFILGKERVELQPLLLPGSSFFQLLVLQHLHTHYIKRFNALLFNFKWLK